MNLKYRIKLLSDWHCGSGLDSGSEADLLVIKDENGMPYIPGKTIKGLLRDACLEMIQVGKMDLEKMNQIFGQASEKKKKPGTARFTNATLREEEYEELVQNGLAPLLYRNIASTAIDEKGVTREYSLRTMEVAIPLELEGEIEGVKETEIIEKAMKWVRHLGSGRNRGLGRCQWEICA